MFADHRFALSMLVLLLGATMTGCQKGAAGPPQLPAPKVTVAHPVARELIDEDDYNGWMDASQTVDVRARVRGHIWKVHFQDGDMVKKDQLLFELDPRPFEAAVNAGEAQVKAIEAKKVYADKDMARDALLVKSAAVTVQEYELSVAKVQVLAAEIVAQQQEVAKEKLNLEFSRITAPIAGRIGRAQLTEGNLVNAGGTDPILATIVAIDPVFIYFTIDERSLQRYQKRGRTDKQDKDAYTSVREQKIPFQFGLDTEEGYPNEGVIDFADNKVDPGTGTIEVRGVIKNDRGLFIPGSRVRVRVPVSDKYEAMLVPDAAINTDQNQKYLLTVTADNTVKRQNVQLGRLLDDGMRLLLRAEPELQKDEWIIVEGMQRARVNYPVEPIQEAASAGTAPAP